MIDTGTSPFALPSFTELLKQLFQSHLNGASSVELISALMEILLTITRESEWQTLFSTPAETQELLNFLVSLSASSSNASQ